MYMKKRDEVTDYRYKPETNIMAVNVQYPGEKPLFNENQFLIESSSEDSEDAG